MLKEYAIEPQAMGSDLNLFCLLMGYFGVERGRLISQFPKNWSQQVIETATASGMQPIKLLSLVERLRSAKQDVLTRRGRTYDPNLENWLANALVEHAKIPFHAIVASNNPGANSAVIDMSDFDATSHLLSVNTCQEVPRTALGIGDALVPLLQMAKEVIIVDPYFEIFKPKYIAPLRSIFEKLDANNSAVKLIQVHRKFDDGPYNLEAISANAPESLNAVIPEGCRLEVFEWAELPDGHDFHDRFLLCDCGGVSIGAGFSAEGPAQSALISLLSKTTVSSLRDRFRPESTAYRLARPVLIIDSGCMVTTRKN